MIREKIEHFVKLTNRKIWLSCEIDSATTRDAKKKLNSEYDDVRDDIENLEYDISEWLVKANCGILVMEIEGEEYAIFPDSIGSLEIVPVMTPEKAEIEFSIRILKPRKNLGPSLYNQI